MENRVAIVGRPNVGKSSLFNRLVTGKRSLVHPEGGTTRDRIEGECLFGKHVCTVVDTGGIFPSKEDAISNQVLSQVRRAIEESTLLLFVVDVKGGLVPLDMEITRLLRKSSKPILLIANKADTATLSESAVDFYPLGLGDPIPVSCVQGLGISDLKARLFQEFHGTVPETPFTPSLRVAVVGRPNVGKSSFLNNLLNDDRLIVDKAPGTTRDPVDIPFRKGEKTYLLIDTAGIRRFSKIRDEILFQSVKTTRRTIQKSDVCLLLLDGSVGIQGEDLQILRWIVEEGRGVVLLVNKWDLVEGISEKQAEQVLKERLGDLQMMPILFTSAVTGKNVVRAVEVAAEVATRHSSRLETHRLNVFLSDIRKRPDRLPGRRVPRLTYLVQIQSSPPHFLLFGSSREDFSLSFQRFLEHRLREVFPLSGTPIVFTFREQKKKR